MVLACAGRTRSLVGAIGLAAIGAAPPVYALENGAQGWMLAGFDVERGAAPAPPPALNAAAAAATRDRAERFIARRRIPIVDATDVARWREDGDRTLYLFDVRAPEEIAADPAPAFAPAQAGQLVQATDRWIGARRARVALLDDLGLRGALAAYWLRMLGYETAVARIDDKLRAAPPAPTPALAAIESVAAPAALEALRRGERGLSTSEARRPTAARGYRARCGASGRGCGVSMRAATRPRF